ncbi:MAG: rRNA pseudouridine synthase [Bacteroidetes bacterium]|nr:rRNA pseudouridine synthase [Bacteroidota bacterium]
MRYNKEENKEKPERKNLIKKSSDRSEKSEPKRLDKKSSDRIEKPESKRFGKKTGERNGKSKPTRYGKKLIVKRDKPESGRYDKKSKVSPSSTFRGTRERAETGRFDKKETGRKEVYRKSSNTTDDNGLVRLNKYISNSGICSRREADELIQSGAVSVNGVIVTELGTKVTPEDSVQFGGETLKKEKPVYILLNKPKDYITTTDDPEGRKTVMVLLKNACKERVYPVGRLDRATTGLLLFTNDGNIAKKLMHPRYQVKKIYHVELDKNLAKVDLEKIISGIELDDGVAEVDEIAFDGDGRDKKCLGVEIHSGKNRIVRRIFESLGYRLLKLDRVTYAGLTKKDLPRGKWRFLSNAEINMLKMIR